VSDNKTYVIERFDPDTVGTEDFEGFMKARGIPETCVICGGNIAISESSNNTIPLLHSSPFPARVEETWVSYAFRTRCLNCGNFQHYDRDEVAKWKKDNTPA